MGDQCQEGSHTDPCRAQRSSAESRDAAEGVAEAAEPSATDRTGMLGVHHPSGRPHPAYRLPGGVGGAGGLLRQLNTSQVVAAVGRCARTGNDDAGAPTTASPAAVVAPLTQKTLQRLETWYGAQGRNEKATPEVPSANKRQLQEEGDGADGDRDSEEDEVYNSRVEQDVVSFIDSVRGFTLYLDPCPPLPTADLTPQSSPRREAPSPSGSSPRPNVKGTTTAAEEKERKMVGVLKRRNAEKRMERAEIEKRIRYITREQLRQVYLDNHEELIECIEELVAAEAKVLDLDDELGALEKRLALAEEELELTKIQLSAAEECNEALISEKAAIMRRLTESKGELAMLGARNVQLQQRLGSEEKPKDGDSSSKRSGSGTDSKALPAPSLEHVKAQRELQEARQQVDTLTAELQAVKGDLAEEQTKRRAAEEAVAVQRAPVDPPPSPRIPAHVRTELEQLRAKCASQETELAAVRHALAAASPRRQQQTHPRCDPSSTPLGNPQGGGDAAESAAEAAGGQLPGSPNHLHVISLDRLRSCSNNSSNANTERSPSSVEAQLLRCERELAIEREHSRNQAEVEVRLLADIAHMTRQLQAKERVERCLRQQRKVDADLSKEQLIGELTALRSTLVVYEATLAALKKQQQQPSPWQSEEGPTRATNTSGDASRSSSATDNLTKDYSSLLLPGMSGTLPTPLQEPQSVRSSSRGSCVLPIGAAACCPCAQSAARPARDVKVESRNASPGRFTSPDMQRRRDSLFAHLEAVRRNRDKDFPGDSSDPKTSDTATTNHGQLFTKDGAGSDTSPPLHRHSHVTNTSGTFNSPPSSSRGGVSGTGSPATVAIVASISPPSRSCGSTLVVCPPSISVAAEAGDATAASAAEGNGMAAAARKAPPVDGGVPKPFPTFPRLETAPTDSLRPFALSSVVGPLGDDTAQSSNNQSLSSSNANASRRLSNEASSANDSTRQQLTGGGNGSRAATRPQRSSLGTGSANNHSTNSSNAPSNRAKSPSLAATAHKAKPTTSEGVANAKKPKASTGVASGVESSGAGGHQGTPGATAAAAAAAFSLGRSRNRRRTGSPRAGARGSTTH